MSPQRKVQTSIALIALLAIALSGLSGVAAAQDGNTVTGDDAHMIDSGEEDPEVVPGGGVAYDAPVVDAGSDDADTFLKAKKAFGTDGSEGGDEVAATRVRKAFLKAKKAFHEGRQDIEDIEKGDEDPVEDVPSFFDSEE